MLRARILKDMDKLEHSKENGFYDKETDLYFDNLDEWAQNKWGVSLNNIIQGLRLLNLNIKVNIKKGDRELKKIYFRTVDVIHKASGKRYTAKAYYTETPSKNRAVELYEGDKKAKTVSLATILRGYQEV